MVFRENVAVEGGSPLRYRGKNWKLLARPISCPQSASLSRPRRTCGQSGCHKASETNIALGKMAEQTDLHCVSCHAFTADVPLLATRDSARGTLVPGKPECLGCHKMQKVLADFDPAKDPHGGKCGTCHNPHVQKTAAAVKTRLAGKEITITSPHGTKLKVGVEPNAAFTNDGVISDDKVKAGGAAVSVYLPAGEVYTRTKPGTATGKVVVPSLAFESEPITDLTLMFEKGSLTEMTANPGKGFDRLQAQYKAAANGKEQLSSIDIGVNPAVKFPKAARDVAFPTGGVVTVGMGGDLWAGGTNKSTFGLAAGLRDATLTVDGKAVVTAGELVK
jgi:hypothetical protein